MKSTAKAVVVAMWENRTKTLGAIQSTLGVMAAATDVFGPHIIAYIVLSSGLSTTLLGYVNDLLDRVAKDEKAPDVAP